MLTRREAKEKPCPYNGNRCIAEHCPKWMDFYDDNWTFFCTQTMWPNRTVIYDDEEQIKECIKKHNVHSCWQCEEHFGYCR